MNFKQSIAAAIAALLALGHAAAADLDAPQIFNTLAPSTVRIEYHLKFDNNTPPPAMLNDKPCPNCGRVHGSSAKQFIEEDRPFEMMGWAVAPDTVLLDDPGISPRFIEAIRVIAPDGGAPVEATQSAFFKDTPMMLLKTATPIPGAVPLALAAAPDATRGKGLLLKLAHANTDWDFNLAKIDLGDVFPTYNDRLGIYTQLPHNGLLLSTNGAPLGFIMTGVWKGKDDAFFRPPFAPDSLVSAHDFSTASATLDGLVNNGIHLATLNFRSPRESGNNNRRRHYWRSDNEEETSTVQYAIALHLAKGRFLVLKNLSPKQTARLESVTLLDAKGQNVAATFGGSLSDYQGFIADAPETLSAPLKLFSRDIRDLAFQSIHQSTITVLGPQITIKNDRARIFAFEHRWKNQIIPELAGDSNASFLFTPQAELVTLPVTRRKVEDDNSYHSSDTFQLSSATLAALIADPPKNAIDPHNAPLSERDENRIAWFGVELQPLTRELARENKVAHLVGDSESRRYGNDGSGAIISLIYPDSPAARAGLNVGDILLRIHAPDRKQPYIIDVSDMESMDDFPWERYDQLPPEMFEHVPTPWRPAENTFTETLTKIGFGKEIRLQAAIQGELKDIPLTIEVSPPTYASAPQANAESLGLYVRDLTFEVRNYFRRKPDDPGIIISRVEPGQHAAIAGIKPYEIITKVGDKPIANINEFMVALANKTDLQITVRRMNRERIVRIDLTKKPMPAKMPDLPLDDDE